MGKKHIATVNKHATQQIKKIDRRFDWKEYIFNEENCADHWNKRVCGKMLESKRVRSGSPTTTTMRVRKKKVRNTYGLDKKVAEH